MFIVFTKPNKFTKTYTEACQIAEDHYQLTGEIVVIINPEDSSKCFTFIHDDYTSF